MMSSPTLTPQEMFSTIGETISDVLIDNQSTSIHKAAISKIDLEMKVEVSPDLKKTSLPSNQNLKLDGHAEKAFFKIRVAAY